MRKKEYIRNQVKTTTDDRRIDYREKTVKEAAQLARAIK